MAEQDLDRSEAATPYRLQKALEQGQAARSTDVINAAVFTAAMAFVGWQGWNAVVSIVNLSKLVFLQADAADVAASFWPLVSQIATKAAQVVLPFMASMMAVAILASIAQTGVIFSFDPIKVDLSRINPATGLKRLFSMRTLFDAARACVKLVVLLVAAGLALKSLFPQLRALPFMSAAAFLHALIGNIGNLGLKMALVLCLVAAVDLMYTRREFGRKMRMSRRELKDEFKNREGDPRIRSRLRELRREVLKRSSALRNTRDANVVLTNPTHYAVALKYVHGEMDAPKLVAKGAGKLAAAMREIAFRNQIPVVRSPALARRLFRELEIEQTLPGEFHPQVARIIVWVFAMRERQRAALGAAV